MTKSRNFTCNDKVTEFLLYDDLLVEIYILDLEDSIPSPIDFVFRRMLHDQAGMHGIVDIVHYHNERTSLFLLRACRDASLQYDLCVGSAWY